MFVLVPQSLLRSYNLADPGPFRAFLATVKHRRAYVAASSGRLLLCAHGVGARYSVVDPASDVWVALPPPPGLEEDVAYVECAAFHCTAGMDFTVGYLSRQHRSNSGALVARWFTSASGRWLTTSTTARGNLRPAAAAACVGGIFYWELVHDDGGSASATGCRGWSQLHKPRAIILACDAEASWTMSLPGEGEEPLHGGLTLLLEAGGLLRYCRTRGELGGGSRSSGAASWRPERASWRAAQAAIRASGYAKERQCPARQRGAGSSAPGAPAVGGAMCSAGERGYGMGKDKEKMGGGEKIRRERG